MGPMCLLEARWEPKRILNYIPTMETIAAVLTKEISSFPSKLL